MTDDEIIAVVQAHKDGKQIQRRLANDSDYAWYDQPEVNWNFAKYDYRVAPEPRKPREFWMNPYNYVCYGSKEAFLTSGNTGELIRVREVIE